MDWYSAAISRSPRLGMVVDVKAPVEISGNKYLQLDLRKEEPDVGEGKERSLRENRTRSQANVLGVDLG
jgi:hypothetical protein